MALKRASDDLPADEIDFSDKFAAALPADLLKILPPYLPGQDPVEYLLNLLKEITKVGGDGVLWVHEITPEDVDRMDRSRTLAYLNHIEPGIDWGKYDDDHKLRKSLHRLLYTHFRGEDGD